MRSANAPISFSVIAASAALKRPTSIAPLVSGSPRMGQTQNIGKPLGLVAGAKCWSARPESPGIWAGCPKGQVGRGGLGSG